MGLAVMQAYSTDTTSQVALVQTGQITLPDLKLPVGGGPG